MAAKTVAVPTSVMAGLINYLMERKMLHNDNEAFGYAKTLTSIWMALAELTGKL